MGDLLLSLEAVKSGLLVLPFNEAVATGEGYYLVWPQDTAFEKDIALLYDRLKRAAPQEIPEGISCLS